MRRGRLGHNGGLRSAREHGEHAHRDASVVRLEDYRPSDFLIDRVELDIRLHPTETRVTRDAGAPAQPGRARGRAARARRRRADLARRSRSTARACAAADYRGDAAGPDDRRSRRARPFTLTIETEINPTANTKLMGLYRSSGSLLHAMRGRGLPPHHLFPRPARTCWPSTPPGIEADRDEAPVLLGNGNPVESGESPARAGTTPSGTTRIPKPSYLFALVGGRARPGRADASRPRAAARSSSPSMSSPARRTAPTTRSTRSSARCAGTRSAFGREYDLDVFNIVAVSDFNMGAMENKGLNIFNDKYVLASPETATDIDYAAYRGDHRARVFPQLDRQPHHLPRLVPALPEGRPDRLPRPGVLLRRALAPGAAHRRGARPCARGSSPRMPARSPIRCGPTQYREINNFYTATVYEKGAEIVRMLKTLDRRRGLPARHGPLLRALRRHGRDGRGFPRRPSPT